MAMSASYLSVNGEILSETRGGSELDYVPDPLGNVTQALDASQTSTGINVYWPYGEVAATTAEWFPPFGFVGMPGYYTDAIGRLYVRARILMTKLARWLTVDPLWPEQKAYEYVSSMPVTATDRSGLGACEVRLDACLENADRFQNGCLDKVKQLLRVAISNCRKLPEPLKSACLAEAQKDAGLGYAACFELANPLYIACGADYLACLARQAKAIVGVVIVGVAVGILCAECPLCCAVLAPLAAVGGASATWERRRC